MIKKTLAIWGLTLLVALSSGCYRAGEATVDGEVITKEELHGALMLSKGHQMLYKLVLQRLIAREAEKLKVSLEPDALKAVYAQIDAQTNDENLNKILKNEVNSRFLLRRILLKDVSEDYLRSLHELFQEDLAPREIFSLTCSSQDEAELVRKELKEGKPFHILAAAHGKYQSDKANGGFRGQFTRSQIASKWGKAIAGLLESVGPHQALDPLVQDGDYVIIYVGNIASSFEELKPALEDLVANAKRPELMYRLLVSAKITSPYLADPKRLPETTLFEHQPLPWETNGQARGKPLISAPVVDDAKETSPPTETGLQIE